MAVTDRSALRDWFDSSLPPGCSARAAAVLDRDGAADEPQWWLELGDALRRDGLIDGGAIPALTHALNHFPGHAGLTGMLAQAEFYAGRDDAARDRLATLAPVDPTAAVLRLKFDLATGMLRREELVEAAGQIINHLPWDQVHEDFVILCRQGGFPDLGVQFVSQWIEHRGNARRPYLCGGEMLLEMGNVASASRVLLDLWKRWDAVSEMIGDWTGIPPDDAAAESHVLGEIEHAFDIPETELPLHPLPDSGCDPAEVTVLYLGAERTGSGLAAVNDLAEHFKAAATAAGGHCTIWLESCLATAHDRRCSDAEAARRRDAFIAELERLRPDILLYDVQDMPGGRTFSVEALRDLKARFGFRLLYVVRDSLKVIDRQIRLWATVVDGLVLFDPRSYLFTASPPIGVPALAVPVPALHAPFTPSGEAPLHQLVFAGSTFGPHRSCLLAGLASADIGLEMVIGTDRARLTPDQDSYARLLASSRAVLNVAAHSTGDGGRLVTGRVWETIGAGSLLIEQLHEGTMAFFAPWRHFLPWSEPADIIRRWRVLSRHEDLRRRIATEARDWALRHYGIDRVWRAILGLGRQ
jgi:hypothetical protein